LKRIGLSVHPTKPEARAAQERIEQICRGGSLEVVDAEGGGAEVVVALGGDGTILRAAWSAITQGVPLLGVNLGNLGFLSTADVSRLGEVVERLAGDDFGTEERMMIRAQASDPSGAQTATFVALNEIVIERGTLSRVVSIRVSVDDEPVATYSADGFIVSTPTGSTAYSLSAGGPVVEPGVQALVLTSVSAHAPLWRSIVVAPDRTVVLHMPYDPTAFSADGQPVAELDAGSQVKVTRHPDMLKLITLDKAPFYEKLRSRFQAEPNH